MGDGVEASNNVAERAIRPAVVVMKITGGKPQRTRSAGDGGLMSVIKTAQQQNRPLFETIKTRLMIAWAGKNPGLLTDVQANAS